MKSRTMMFAICIFCVLLALLGLSACADDVTIQTTTPTTEPTQPTDPTEPQPVDAADLLAQIDISTLKNDTFFEIFELAGAFLEEHTLISVPSTEYTRAFLKSPRYTNKFEQPEETSNILLDVEKYADDEDALSIMQDLLMVYCLSEKYADYVVLVNHGIMHDFPRECYAMHIYPSFPESGFSDTIEYYVAIMKGEIPIPEDAYEVYFCYHGVKKLTGGKNLLIFPQG